LTIVGSAGFADLGILEKTEFEMKQKAKFLFLLGIVNCQLSIVSSQEHVVPFSFGDMDHWVVREIHESGIIGGNTKHLYELGPQIRSSAIQPIRTEAVRRGRTPT